uniref:NADH dehydrogenase subunit 4L n=1 Tax=Nototeredo knoxi TaxID=2939324 RepID=UPI00202923C3|nr:NADH dehydrogenase subunit 4L [Nototeredo knoxi]UPX89281.1 NADH dehydrogenase subunit 4L [Nototeredo knoxi]
MFLINWGFKIMFKSFLDFLSLLIFLEMLVITVFTGLMLFLASVGNWLTCYTMMSFLTFFVCEAIVGLSLLVGAARQLEFYSCSNFCALKF